jgi:ribosomal protein L3
MKAAQDRIVDHPVTIPVTVVTRNPCRVAGLFFPHPPVQQGEQAQGAG